MATQIKKEHLILVPESEWKKAATGKKVVAGNWWIVTPDNELVYFTSDKGGSVAPQCNADENVARTVFGELNFPIDVELKKIELAYAAPRDSRWRRYYANWRADKPKQKNPVSEDGISIDEISIMRQWLSRQNDIRVVANDGKEISLENCGRDFLNVVLDNMDDDQISRIIENTKNMESEIHGIKNKWEEIRFETAAANAIEKSSGMRM